GESGVEGEIPEPGFDLPPSLLSTLCWEVWAWASAQAVYLVVW
ncbi:unnamed protein product, partial [Arabidopsis halleri]